MPARFMGVKIGNEYASVLGDLYNKMPKAVLAGILVSLVSTGGDRPDEAVPVIIKEWWALHRAGIIQQKPTEPEPE